MKEKPSQIERIKAILEVLHELPIDEEADQRVSDEDSRRYTKEVWRLR